MLENRFDNNFLCHVVRDVFKPIDPVILFGENLDLLNRLHSSEHGIGAFLLHLNPNDKFVDKFNDLNFNKDLCHQWLLEFNNSFFGFDFCNLFISIDYQPRMIVNDYRSSALHLKNLMKKNGLIFLTNPGNWALGLNDLFLRRDDLISDIYRYSMFKNKKVLVYENI